MKTEKTTVYPTRYAAFDNNGILFEAEKPEMSGGYEWAVYDDRQKGIYGDIVSYQNEGLTVGIYNHGKFKEIPQKGYMRLWDYSEFNLAKEALIEGLGEIIGN